MGSDVTDTRWTPTGGTPPGAAARSDLTVGRVDRRLGGRRAASGNGLSTSVARVSLAKNKATIKASSTSVRKGNRVTFTVKLARPDSKNTIRGLPVALQRAPRSGGSFSTIRSGTTAANGTAEWRVKVKKATRYRTLGKAVKQTRRRGAVDRQGHEPAGDGHSAVSAERALRVI